MSGFLRQLASRSVGTSPRLRSAPSPRAVALVGTVPRDAWRGEAQGLRAAPAESDARVQTARDDARSNLASFAQTPSHAADSGGIGQTARNVDAAGGDEHDAAHDARRHRAQFSVTAPIAEADVPPHNLARGDQDVPSPVRLSRALRSVEADKHAADDRQPRPAAVSPITSPLPTDKSGAYEVTGSAHPAAPRDSTFSAEARELAAPRARSHAADAASAPRLPAQPSSPPDVHITIDRLEVVPPPQRAAAAAPRSSALSLRAYLTARRTGLP
ncbi:MULTISPECIES: hypothetical protein [Achromobacter]|uniref:hypothetical protein n=1 Tax=Achromobacter TaxID=222 RepID=UPI0025BAE055|nr:MULTISPECIES: hypothetical protein [Achromobacter]